jgi:hypothetical protein
MEGSNPHSPAAALQVDLDNPIEGRALRADEVSRFLFTCRQLRLYVVPSIRTA